MAAVEKAKQQRLLRAIEELLKHPENRHCCDCGDENPRFCSITLGSFICTRCAGIHRKIGIHVSRVKSVSHDQFTTEQVDLLKQWGNKKVQHKYRYKAPARPDLTSDAAVTAWIQAQYEKKQWLRPVGATDDDTSSAAAADAPPHDAAASRPAGGGANFNAGFSSFPAPLSPGRTPQAAHPPAPSPAPAPVAAPVSSDPMADLLFGGPTPAAAPAGAAVATQSSMAAVAGPPKPAGKDDIMALYANHPRVPASGPNYNVNVGGPTPMMAPPGGGMVPVGYPQPQVVMTPQGPMMLQPQPNGTMVMIPISTMPMAPPVAAGSPYGAPPALGGNPFGAAGGGVSPFASTPAPPAATPKAAANPGHRFDFGGGAAPPPASSPMGSLL